MPLLLSLVCVSKRPSIIANVWIFRTQVKLSVALDWLAVRGVEVVADDAGVGDLEIGLDADIRNALPH